MSDHARRVQDAALDARAAQTALEDTVRAALADGARITDVAAAAGVTRQTIYRWRDAG